MFHLSNFYTVMLIHVVVLTCARSTHYNTNLNLGPLYKCNQSSDFVFGYPSLKTCSHTMLHKEVHICIPWGSLSILTIDCHLPNLLLTFRNYNNEKSYWKNTFEKKRLQTAHLVLVSDQSCLQAGLNPIVSLSYNNRTLTKVIGTQ